MKTTIVKIPVSRFNKFLCTCQKIRQVNKINSAGRIDYTIRYGINSLAHISRNGKTINGIFYTNN